VKKSCVAAYPVGWPDGRGISGRIRVEWVAGSPWNRWSDAHGMGGQMTVESADFRRHVDYVYVNPLKHGLVRHIRDWPYSSFHRDVRAGLYPADWAGGSKLLVPGNERGMTDRFS